MAIEREALLVVRAHVERRSSKPLRATVRLTPDTTQGFTDAMTLTDVDSVAEVVRQWLTAVIEGAE